MIRALVECWEIPHNQRPEAEQRGCRLGTHQRATSVTLPGSPVDPPPTGSLLWRRTGSAAEGQRWLAGERAPEAPWAERARLVRVAAGYIYEDPDLPGFWFATRQPQPDRCARDEGPFESSHDACASLLGARPAPDGIRTRGGAPPGETSRERGWEAISRAPLPGELLDEARAAGAGASVLLRAWPEAARLPLEPAGWRQAIGRVSLLSQIEALDPDAAQQEAAWVIAHLTRLLREWSGSDEEPEPVRRAPARLGMAGARDLLRRARRRLRAGGRPVDGADRLRVLRSRRDEPGRRRDGAAMAPGARAADAVAAADGHEARAGEVAMLTEWSAAAQDSAGRERPGAPPVAGQKGRRGVFQLEERHLALQIGRLAAVAAVGAAAILWFEPSFAVRESDVLIASAATLAAHMALLLAPLRWPSLLRLAVDTSLIADAAWVVGVALGSGSSDSPLVGLFFLTALIATLGYSGRTGAKAAILASLGYLGLVWHDGGSVWGEASATRILALWGIVSITAAAAAIGQRELRRRAERLGILQHAGSELLAISNPTTLEEVARTAAEQLLPGWAVSTRRGEGPEEIRLAREGSEAVVAVPVSNGSTSIGVIECRRPGRVGRSTTSVRARDLACLRDLGAALGVALSRSDLVDALARASATDSLTGLANRRTLDAALARELAGVRRHGRPLSLCLLDVDHFKGFNDAFGHPAGDRALQLVAGAVQAEVRGTDVAARYGGEEFAALLPDTGLEAALVVAERIRSTVAGLPTPGRPVTVSIGVSVTESPCFPDELIAAADEALYAAKDAGRNRVEAGGVPPPAVS